MKTRLAIATFLLASQAAVADEGGVSFWLPGQMGSFAAVPVEPGWSLPLFYYHTSTDAKGGKALTHGSRITAGLDAKANLLFGVPTYTFKEPVWGAQAGLGAGFAVGKVNAEIDATLTGPFGGTLASGRESDSRSGGSDLYPIGTLKWNRGVHNFMAYMMGGLPTGDYTAGRLANIGTNHYSLDAGGGYTYLNPKTGHEFSAVLGFTKNFENKDTNYKNGTDAHLDWAASKFHGAQLHYGLVGYFYRQIGGDSGAGAVLGDNKSRVSGIGPQVGYFFPVDGRKWYMNAKVIGEFDGKHRADGWNFWLTLAIPFGEGK
jgi:hypothetical protein